MRKPTGFEVKVLAGSACFWAWLDAVFMSTFFPTKAAGSFMPEVASVLVFAVSAVAFALAVARPARVAPWLQGRALPLAAAALGTVGSLLFVAASAASSWGLLAAASAGAGLFMGVFQLGWGALYCAKGAKSAAFYASGGFAGAIVIDVPLLFMTPTAAAVFYALLPLACALLFTSIPGPARAYPAAVEAPVTPGLFGNRLGLSATFLGAAILVLLSFGFLQHVASFSAMANVGFTSGVFIQLMRGLMAVAAFAIVIFAPQKTILLYKVGLLAMIAGFMLMSFFFGTPSFGIAGAVVMGGYTVFDLLLWVLSSQIAKNRSAVPLRTMALVRLIAVLCYVAGMAVALLLVGAGPKAGAYVFQETIVVGYLVVIATVLLLSTKDMWELWGVGADSAAAPEERERPARVVRRHRAHAPRAGRGGPAGRRPHPTVDRREPLHFREHRGQPRAPHLPEGVRARPPTVH